MAVVDHLLNTHTFLNININKNILPTSGYNPGAKIQKNSIFLSVSIIFEIVLKVLRIEMAKMEMCPVLFFFLNFLKQERTSVLAGCSSDTQASKLWSVICSKPHGWLVTVPAPFSGFPGISLHANPPSSVVRLLSGTQLRQHRQLNGMSTSRISDKPNA